MVFLLGMNFDERLLVRKALTSLYGISQSSTAYMKHRGPASLPAVITSVETLHKQIGPSSSSSSSPSSSLQQSNPHPTHEPSNARHSLLARLMAQHHIHPAAKLRDLPESKIVALTASLSELTIENDLRRKMQQNIARLRDIGSYRGRRHAMNLPVRGQKTRSQITTARKLNRVERRA